MKNVCATLKDFKTSGKTSGKTCIALSVVHLVCRGKQDQKGDLFRLVSCKAMCMCEAELHVLIQHISMKMCPVTRSLFKYNFSEGNGKGSHHVYQNCRLVLA